MNICKSCLTFSLLLTCILFGCYDSSVSDESNTSPIVWKGMLESAPIKPETNWVYYNIQLKTSFIFDGVVWDTMVVKGIDGVSMQWLGSLESPPVDPLPHSAYYNSTLNVSFLFTGTGWDTLTCGGQDGLSIQWKGNLDTPPENPQENWIYYDLTLKNSYIYSNKDWQLFVTDGLSGLGIQWLGSFDTHPQDPPRNGAYYNRVKACSYLFDGSGWMIIARDGTSGDAGSSIVWLGEKLYAPVDPLINWAYFSLIDFNSYIFDGTEWQLLAKSGDNGISIVWVGELDHFPDTPKLNWAFFNRVDGRSYIFDGEEWQILIQSGKDGEDGLSMVWLGTFATHPTEADINNIYYNSLSNTTYIYTGNRWEVFAVGGNDGFDGWDGIDGKDGINLKKLCAHKSQYIWSGDTLFLTHNFGSWSTSFIGQYVNPHDSTIRSYDDRDTTWFPPFDSVFSKELYAVSDTSQERVLFTRNDGSVIQVYNESDELYKGGLIIAINEQGVEGSPFRFCQSDIAHITVQEDIHNTLYITYIDKTQDSVAILTTITSDEQITHTTLSEGPLQAIQAVLRKDGSLVAVYPVTEGFQFRVVSSEMSISDPTPFASSAEDSSFSIAILQTGAVQFYGVSESLIAASIHPDNSVTEKIISEIVNPTSVYSFIEQKSGMQIVPVSLFNSQGFQERDLVLLQLTSENTIHRLDTLSMNCIDIELDLLQDDTVSVLFRINIPYRMITYHTILSPNMEKLSESMLDDLLQHPVTTVKNNEIYVTHTYENINRGVHLLRLRKSHHYPQLQLKMLSDKEAGLINHTGRCLLLTLTAYDKPLTRSEALREGATFSRQTMGSSPRYRL